MLRQLREWWERRETSTLSNPQPWLKETLGLEDTHSGIGVTSESALKYTAVFACVRVLAESVAGLPLHLYRRDGDARERATDHALYPVLHDQPNDYQSSYDFRLLLMTHMLLFGNAYAEIELGAAGDVRALWPIRPDCIRLRADSGRIWYDVSIGGNPVRLPFERVLHLRGLSTDGWNGLSPIAAARQSIGLSLAAERFGAAYFGKGSRVGGVVTVPEKLNEKAKENLRQAWDARHAGPDNFHGVAVLEGGMDFKPFTISNEDSQFIETRRLGIEDIARIYRVPPHMIADLSKANYSNVDALDRAFAKYSITPWTSNLEQSMALKLLGPRQRRNYFIEFDLNGLLRGDHEARMRAYQAGIYSGIYAPNEARRAENLPPREGGDVFLQPTNTAPSPYYPQQNGAQQQ